ncbi:hypothetical protein HanXRQr2_Chr15g0694801 [Helianthus annuus]|uniref:Uncharacterized protein n=1 Tax=Helianthus annuus TaxID=4232 RepID=A0A251S8Z2_HELAN|nr:hypothetical protein HanXRQr2_Chr15g0694801 [Helianthus annuus]KAJ0455804.1 hypothetical protein HanIR_Chr15g0755211 [Helianthus annuus]KAJ0831410.1 hypothetical protein HanPSC8_Chr15g0666691 [Helianthus annuus]
MQQNLTRIQRKGINVACPTPRQHLPKQKQRNRRLTTALCPANTGAWPVVCRKDKAIEASIPSTGACPAQHGPWSTLRFAESSKS